MAEQVAQRADEDWVRLIKQDDPQIIHDLWKLLFTYAQGLKNRYRECDDPSGLVYDATVSAYRRIIERGVYQFRFECPFPGYCRVILVREVLRLVRDQNKQPTLVELPDDEALAGDEMPLRVDVYKVRGRLQPCLGQLPPRQQEIIERLYIKEEKPQTIANQLEISRHYVNVIASRARRKLRGCLEKHGYNTSADVLYTL